MLRASAQEVGQPVDAVEAVNGTDVEQAVPHGPLLVGFVDAVLGDEPDRAESARVRLATSATPAAVADAAAVLANFEMMTRVADSTGARVAAGRLDSTVHEREALGVNAFPSTR
jgi:hypothetical protein